MCDKWGLSLFIRGLIALGVVGVLQQPTFRGGVSLVTIDVTVLDGDGRPVLGLTAADLEIALDGKIQPIRAFALVQAAPASAPAAQAAAVTPTPTLASAAAITGGPRRTFTNVSAAPTAPAPEPSSARVTSPSEQRTFVLLVDDLSFDPSRGRRMFNAAQRFLDRVPASDPVGFTTTTGIGAMNPTRDRAAVRAALSKVMGQFNDPRGMRKTGPSGGARVAGSDSPLGISESIDIERGDDSLLKDVIVRECFANNRAAFNGVSLAEMLRQSCPSDVRQEARQIGALMRQNRGRQVEGIRSTIRAMSTTGGIRHLVLLSDGLAVSRDIDELHPLVRAAAEAGVQLSVLMEEPDISVTDDARGESMSAKTQTDIGQSRRRRDDDALFMNGLRTMTDMLGGTFHRVIGTPDPFFDRVLVESAAVYRVGVELPADAKPGDVFEVKATVARPGLRARVNRFTVAVPAATAPVEAPRPAATASAPPVSASSLDDLAKRALESKTPASDIPIRIAAYQRRSASAPGQIDVSVTVAIPASAGSPLNTYVGVVDAKGAMRNSGTVLHAPDSGGYEVSFMFPLAPGAYRIRYAAVNERRQTGNVELPLEVKLEDAGAFTISDVLTWYVDGSNKAKLFALDEIPQGVDTVRASLELYPPAGAGVEPPVVHWSIAREGSDAVESLGSAAPLNNGVFRADASFPFAELAPGRYVIRAEVMIQGRSAGMKAAVVMKAGGSPQARYRPDPSPASAREARAARHPR